MERANPTIRGDESVMSARRCSFCAINWPPTSEYKVCPICEGENSPFFNATPLDADDAAQMKRHAEFERYYTERNRLKVSGRT